ncbi:hypothetical protein U8335_13625 [Roseiconus lacunae]|uniref:hypothetical protein n=1 Tax=Roseiconus lacunae TaxID=2605694 RepID=UPI00308E11E2|nr:hypothetical protein U8335_13625 [Stieleria sp. HD01]
MTENQVKSVLYGIGSLCVVCALAVMTAAVYLPVNMELDHEGKHQPIRIRPNVHGDRHRLKERDFYALSSKILQGRVSPPSDQQANDQAEKQPEVEKALDVHAVLLGTLVDRQAALSRAWVLFQGKQQLVRVGDTLEGHPKSPVVTEITTRSILIEKGESSVLLESPESKLMQPSPKDHRK